MRRKFRSVYIFAILVFIAINIMAILFVFKKYRRDSNDSMLVSRVKFKYSKLKDKIVRLETKIPLKDSVLNDRFSSLENDKYYLDSALSFDIISKESLKKLANKIFETSLKSNELEKSIELASNQNQIIDDKELGELPTD